MVFQHVFIRLHNKVNIYSQVMQLFARIEYAFA